jgi:predicted Zn-dependent protease
MKNLSALRRPEGIRMRFFHWCLIAIVVAGLPFLLGNSGCNGGSVDNLFMVDEEQEISIGQQGAVAIEKQYGVLPNHPDLLRLNKIGKAIAARTQRTQLPWTFRVINESSVNAFALPGGPIYVSKGLLDLNVSDSELAGVLAHEAAHINQRHSAQAIAKQIEYEMIAGLVLKNAGDVAQVAAGLAMQYGVTLPHTRKDEYEADALGVRLAYNTGYPANGLVQFLNRLEKLTGGAQTPEWMQSHPLIAERITRAQEIVNLVTAQARPVPLTLTTKEQDVQQNLP